MGFERKVFGRKKVPPAQSVTGLPERPPQTAAVQAQPQSQQRDVNRVSAAALFSGPQGKRLQTIASQGSPIPPSMGSQPADDPLKASLARQEERRCAIEADMLERFGHNNIRPFFTCGEGVINTDLGRWMVNQMNLLPYDEWNVTYLPMDEPTAAIMDLPLHPQCSIDPVDQLIVERLSPIKQKVEEALVQSQRIMGDVYEPEIAEKFVEFADLQKRNILDYIVYIKPMVIEMIADVQQGQ